MMRLKKIIAACAIMTVALAAFAETREALSKIAVNKKGSNFQYWTKDSAALESLKSYVKDATNKKSANFIPVEDRIAVFDMDGTLLGERSPCYFEWMMYLERALNDESYTPSEEDRAYAEVVKDAIYNSGIPGDMEGKEARSQSSVFAGMTQEEYAEYVKKFMETKAEGLTNLKRGEEFYLPMLEVVSFLNNNDFTVYIVSGSDRDAIRILVDGVLDVKPNHIIGTDAMILAENQGDKDGLDYTFKKEGEKLVRGQFLLKDVKMNKVLNIAQEIGKRPVLAFGNSSGDSSMFNYTISNPQYKGLAFSLCCDDLEDDLGNTAKADKMKADCEKNGWIAISMRDDWTTIYGYNVKVEK